MTGQQSKLKRPVPFKDKGVPTCLTYILLYLTDDDQFMIQESEDILHKAVYQHHLLCWEYNMKISISKTKVVALREAEYVC